MNLDELTAFIAKQLNDHETSPRGVEQPSYYTWTEHHIHDALSMALSYLYSIKPDLFAEPACVITTKDSCLVDLSDDCCNVLNIIGVGSDCDNVAEESQDTNDLLPLLSLSHCVSGGASGEDTTYTYKFFGEGILQFNPSVPKGTPIHFICGEPKNISELDECILTEYQTLFVSFALWYLLLTDNESRSNPLRWEAYYRQVQDFVTLKLRLEFSLRAEDYIDGNKQTPKVEVDING